MRALGKAAIVFGIVGGVLGVAWMQLPPGATRRDTGFHAFEKYPEPSAEIVASGQCVVPVCTDVDLGDRRVRFYAAGITRSHLTYIPRGACHCEAINRVKLPNRSLPMDFEATGERKAYGASLVQVECASKTLPNRARPPSESSYEKFHRLIHEYKEVSDFRFRDESYSRYRVFEHQEEQDRPMKRYYFLPKSGQIEVDGRVQPIAFAVELDADLARAQKIETPTRQIGLSAYSVVRISECVTLSKRFAVSRAESSQWMAQLSLAVDTITRTRIFRDE